MPRSGERLFVLQRPHYGESCELRQKNIQRLSEGRRPVRFCDYTLCANPYDHETIRCVSLARICHDCKVRGHCRISRRILREWFEKVKLKHIVVSNPRFSFDFPKKQRVFKVKAPQIDEELLPVVLDPKLKESEEVIEEFMLRMSQIHNEDSEFIRKEARSFAISKETQIRNGDG